MLTAFPVPGAEAPAAKHCTVSCAPPFTETFMLQLCDRSTPEPHAVTAAATAIASLLVIQSPCGSAHPARRAGESIRLRGTGKKSARNSAAASAAGGGR